MTVPMATASPCSHTPYPDEVSMACPKVWPKFNVARKFAVLIYITKLRGRPLFREARESARGTYARLQKRLTRDEKVFSRTSGDAACWCVLEKNHSRSSAATT